MCDQMAGRREGKSDGQTGRRQEGEQTMGGRGETGGWTGGRVDDGGTEEKNSTFRR